MSWKLSWLHAETGFINGQIILYISSRETIESCPNVSIKSSGGTQDLIIVHLFFCHCKLFTMFFLPLLSVSEKNNNVKIIII